MTEPSSKAIDRLVDAVAASREAGERRIEALERVVEKSNQNVVRAVEEIKQSAERVERQVGVMSEHLTAIDIKIELLTDQIRELVSAVNGHLRVAEKQADNIAELTKLVASQANTVNMLISRTGS